MFSNYKNVDDLRNKTPPRREAKTYTCSHCSKTFANSSYLSQHRRIHLGIKQYGPCNYCQKMFTQLSHLQQHLRTHTGEKPYKCRFLGCEKTFSQMSNLQNHTRRHQADKPFKCNSCYKCFPDEKSLLDHIPTHQQTNHLKIHVCPFCGKSYAHATLLSKHMTKHADRRNDTREREMKFESGWPSATTSETNGINHHLPTNGSNSMNMLMAAHNQMPYRNANQMSTSGQQQFMNLTGLAALNQRIEAATATATPHNHYFSYDGYKPTTNELASNQSFANHNHLISLNYIQQYAGHMSSQQVQPETFSTPTLTHREQ